MANTQGLINGGRGGLFWSYIWTLAGYGLLAASLADMASMCPTAGGQVRTARLTLTYKIADTRASITGFQVSLLETKTFLQKLTIIQRILASKISTGAKLCLWMAFSALLASRECFRTLPLRQTHPGAHSDRESSIRGARLARLAPRGSSHSDLRLLQHLC